MRRDLHSKSLDRSPTQGYSKFRGPIIEAGGIPKPSNFKKDDLNRRFAQRLGMLTRPDVPIVQPERFTTKELGNPELPVFQFKDEIIQSVQTNPISIVVAETGAGKSTQIPQYLLEQGFEVTMTQPRRIAASMLAEQIEREITADDKLGANERGIVGYRTAENSSITERTRISVVTDGLRLVEELNEHEEVTDEVLIIDEVHEWNKNIEILVAWVKKSLLDRPNLRVVIMSATMDAHKLAYYFSDQINLPPIIEIPGRSNSIERESLPDSTSAEEAVKAAIDDLTVLIFLPGVREIEKEMQRISQLLEQHHIYDVTVLPLHGNLSVQQQDAVKATYHGPKIICATNVAQTSITIPDVDVVIDTGLERRVEINQYGVESLRMNEVSQADCDQRAGRCGRTKPGRYILTKMDDDYPFEPYMNRLKYPVPEILRTNIHRSTLAVANAGLDFSELPLFHPVSQDSIERSKYHLRLLGAFDEHDIITHRGHRMNKLPVRPSSARMMVYAEDENYSAVMKSYVAAIAACIEVGDLPDYMDGESWRSLSNTRDSDYIAQLDMFLWAQSVNNRRELAEAGLNVRRVERAKELHAKLVRRLRAQPGILPDELTDADHQLINDAVVAGMVDFVYQSRGGDYLDALGRYKEIRSISDRSKVSGHPSGYVIGTPYRIPPSPRYKEEKHILQHVSKISVDALGRVAAWLCDWDERGELLWRDGRPKTVQQKLFRASIPIDEWREVDTEWSTGLQTEIVRLYKEKRKGAYRELLSIKKETERLWHMSDDVRRMTQEDVDTFVKRASTGKLTSPDHLDAKLRQILLNESITLDVYISEDERNKIIERSPDFIEWHGMNLQIGYKSGEPYLRHVSKDLILQMLNHGDVLKLPDRRKVQVTLGRKTQTLWAFGQDKKNGKL